MRCFIAIELSSSTIGRCLQLIKQLRPAGGPSVRWAGVEQMHLTLSFLGDVPLTEMHSLCRAAANVGEQLGEFEVQCGGAGAFPDLARPRTIWIGVRPCEPLMQLQRQLNESLLQAGWHPDQRRYHPHVTLGRLRGECPPGLSQRLEQLGEFAGGATDVDQIVVFSSRMAPGGPQYEALGHVELSGPAFPGE